MQTLNNKRVTSALECLDNIGLRFREIKTKISCECKLDFLKKRNWKELIHVMYVTTEKIEKLCKKSDTQGTEKVRQREDFPLPAEGISCIGYYS